MKNVMRVIFGAVVIPLALACSGAPFAPPTTAGHDIPAAGNSDGGLPVGVPLDGWYLPDTNVVAGKNPDGSLKVPAVFDYPSIPQQPLGEGKTVQRFSSLLNELVTPDRRVFLRMKYEYEGSPFSSIVVRLAAVDGELNGGWTPYSGNVPELLGGIAKRVADAGTALVYEYQLPKGTPYGNLKFTWRALASTGEVSETDYRLTLVPGPPPVVITEDENYSKANDPESIWYVNAGRLSGYRPGARIVRYQVQNPLDERVLIRLMEIESASEVPSRVAPLSITETWNISNDSTGAGTQKKAKPSCFEQGYYHPYFSREGHPWEVYFENTTSGGNYDGKLCDDQQSRSRDNAYGKELWGDCLSKVASKVDGADLKRNVCHSLPNWAPCGKGHSKKPFLPASKYESSCSNWDGSPQNFLCIDTELVGDPMGFLGSGPLVFTSQFQANRDDTYSDVAIVSIDGHETKAGIWRNSLSRHPAWVIPASSENTSFDIYLVSHVDREAAKIQSPQGVPAPSIVDTSTDLNYLGYTYDTHGCLRYADDSPADARCTSTGAFVYAWPYLRDSFGGVCGKQETWTTSKWDGYSVYGQLTSSTFKIDVKANFWFYVDASPGVIAYTAGGARLSSSVRVDRVVK